MKIHKIEIKNFKGFAQQTFEFNSQFTVLIGNNGKGKTSAMEALAVALGAYILGIGYSAPQRHIQKTDIRKVHLEGRYAYQFPVEVWAEGDIDEYKNLKWGRILKSYEGRTSIKEATNITEISKSHQQKTNSPTDSRVNLPVLAYYSTGRLWIGKNQRINTKSKGDILYDGYYACLEPASDSIAYLEWFHTYEYSILTKGKDKTLLNLVKKAISDCVVGWQDVFFDFEENDLVGKMLLDNGETQFVPFRLLSDGQRNIVGIVAELAYRCITLNGHLGVNALRDSKGVVLIDEIDIHLHPRWQKRIVGDLKRTFPNIQFIATTHSPFIVQSLEADEIVNLENPENREGLDGAPFKHSIEDIAEFEMGVEMPQRSQKFLEMQQHAKEFFELVGQNASPTHLQQAKQKLDELRILFNNDPAYIALLQSELPLE